MGLIMNQATVFLEKIDEWKLDTFELDASTRQPMVFKDDPVAMAIAVYRCWKETPAMGIRWADLEDAVITAEDRQVSAELRKYYADRIMITMLGNNKISEFRRKLYGVVTNSMSLNKSDIGLLYRLPYFYEEDLAVDRVMERTQSVQKREPTDRVHGCFTVIERVLISRRAGDYTQLWMTRKGSSAPYMITVKSDNPYHRLIIKLLEQPRELSAWAHTKYHKGHHRGHGYYMLGDIELV
jgi:hypothetical protein